MNRYFQFVVCSFVVFLLGACSTSQSSDSTASPKAEIESQVEVVENTDVPGVTYSSVDTLRSKVLNVDLQARTITLVDEQGNPFLFAAGEEVRNLDQVSVGDELLVEYIERISIELVPTEKGKAAVAGVTEAARAPKGEMPAGAIVNTAVELLEVVEINMENQTFKLKDVTGEIEEFVARNPENLTKAKIGDTVMITTQEALAVGIVKVTNNLSAQ